MSWIIHRSFIGIIVVLVLSTGCSSRESNGIQRIALIAPFEGRYSEIGYDAYYAVRLAIKDHGTNQIELLAIDDGGSGSSAAERAKALANDPLVKVVIALGNNATQTEAQQAFGNIPVLIIGQWHAKPVGQNIYMLASKQLENTLTSKAAGLEEVLQIQSAVIGGEIFALRQFSTLSKSLNDVTIASSASPPNEEFRKRYLSSGQFVPEPGLLATLTYDAAGMALEAVQNSDPNKTIGSMIYKGLNGDIHFVNGYWVDAPIYFYRYDSNDQLALEERPLK